MKITIIGSFRKYYNEICKLIDEFEEKGVEIMSPKKSYIIEDVDGFVILNSDEKNQQPFIIQEHVFENIKKSKAVYVWNPEGYMGNSTCYEIGKIMEMRKPIFYKEVPKDLPIKIDNSMIKNVDGMIAWLHSDQ